MTDWQLIYGELKGWQALIGSALGFGALTWGALYNFRLNRRRDEHLRSDEVIAIASALYGEIYLLRRSTAKLAQFVGSRALRQGMREDENAFDRYFREMVEISPPKLYPALATKIGVLPSQMALEIGKFYARIEEAQAWLPRLQDDPERKYSYSVASVLRPAVDAVTLIVPTLREIEKMSGIQKDDETLAIDKAVLMLDMEDEFHADHESS